MADYTVLACVGGHFPYCIDQIDADGSRTIIERWQTEALAIDRLLDIQEEITVLERRLLRQLRPEARFV
jgi:hypothetical protein